MRDVFVKTLRTIVERDPRVILMTGDLGFGVLTEFERDFPRNYLNVGVAEQNLAGLATGLAMSGHTVFTYSIANFPTLRCLEQIRNDVCYHRAPVKIVAIGGGFSYGVLGISHHATEDVSIMRALPEMTVFCPGDLYEAGAATLAAYETPGPCYLRLDKSAATPGAAAARTFELGCPRRLRAGDDRMTILGGGGILEEVLSAAEILAADGLDCSVFSLHTIKPLDVDSIAGIARRASLLVTVEEHTLDGGLGSAVLEACATAGVWPKAFRRFGLSVGFSSLVGSQRYLRMRYGLDADALVAGIRAAVARPEHQWPLERI